MTSAPTTSTWDLSPVLSLIQTLSNPDPAKNTPVGASVVIDKVTASTENQTIRQAIDNKLGDFNRIWDFLGVQRDIPVLTVATFEASTAAQAKDFDAYASDGALYYPPSSKSVKWRDEEEGLNLTDVQPDSPTEDGQLTKNQRKKRNRKARKAAETVDAVESTAVTRSKSSTQINKDVAQPTPPVAEAINTSAMSVKPSTTTQTRDKKSIDHVKTKQQVNGNPPKHLTPNLSSNVVPSAEVGPQSTATSPRSKGCFRPPQVTPNPPKVASKNARVPSVSFDKVQVSALHKTPQKSCVGSAIHQSLQKNRPVADLYAAAQNAFLTPNPPQFRINAAVPTPTRAVVATTGGTTESTTRKRYEILPFQYSNAVDRNWSLLLKLMQNFPEDRAHLLSPLQLSINRPTPDGIHVFVDASNIIIGFHETLKRARKIPLFARVPRVNLNFHALALLLERRRPVSKRVLAGSTPEIAAFEEARQVGYETCILDKVWKAKELTERQRRFATRAGGDSSGYQSGSDSAGFNLFSSSPGKVPAAPPQQPKWVEQAVDEILHLKILESIVDTPATPVTPADITQGMNGGSANTATCPTMILATGDAAEAEYSPGFQKMVQRALQKGWIVEVMAWGKSISAEYRRMTQSPALAGRFRLIELDQYAEELFGEVV